MADIIRHAGPGFVERSHRWINGQHLRVLDAITRCPTAALGGHRDRCGDCGHTAISYDSCRNRHFPRCQANARLHWIGQRDLLPTRYVHAVFTLPREIAPLALQNKRLLYALLQLRCNTKRFLQHTPVHYVTVTTHARLTPLPTLLNRTR